MTDRSGVEIDYCPKCRGVWLDRGELDKIIERASGSPADPVAARPAPAQAPISYAEPGRAAPPPPPRDDRRDDRRYRDDDDDDRRYRNDDGYPKRKRRGSFLDDLFDF